MAGCEALPIDRAALDVAAGFEKRVAGLSRYRKYTLGSKPRNGSRCLLGQAVRANGSRERLPELLVLRERLDSLLLTIRLAREIRLLKSFPFRASA